MDTWLETYDTERLEAQWDVPDEPSRVVVFCHPHPQHGGTMNAPLMRAVTHHLVSGGISVLRFNFRGVGESSGTWDNGVGEIHDVDAAVELALEQPLPVTVVGWSFGAATSLRWQAVNRSELPWVGIAPPVPPAADYSLPGVDDLAEAPRTIIIGDRDQLVDPTHAEAYAASIGARFELMTGSDHFFYFREERVAELVLAALS